MNIINVSGSTETVSDYYDGIDLARDTMGEDWYKFMKRELDDAEFEFDRKDEEIQEYKHSEEILLEEYQGYLHEIQELAEQCIKEEVITGPTTKRMERIYKYLDGIKNICYKNT